MLTIVALCLGTGTAWATHNRAGEITFRQTGKNTFEVTLITYTDSRSPAADRPQIDIVWGDSTTERINRKTQIPLANNTLKNIYVKSHTYPGPGKYKIQFTDPNRIQDIANIQGSVNVPFYVESLLIIDPLVGYNNSPILLQPPIDIACVNNIFIHNPNAYDPDGDSLVFTLIPPKKAANKDVPGYQTPSASNYFTIDKFKGEVTWKNPNRIGIYNIAILIEEYRYGKRIGYVERDMQITVEPCNDNPPEIGPLHDTCVEAGTNIKMMIPVSAFDQDSDEIQITATGGPFLQKISPAVFSPDPAIGTKNAYAQFTWNIDCAHIRRQPYRVVFKAEETKKEPNASILKHMDIKVVGPPPINLNAKAVNGHINLSWAKPVCANVRGYLIYRRMDSTVWQHAYCETGVPAYTGFQIIDTIIDPEITNYSDDARGAGLSPGIEYCYHVTALYLNDGQFEFAEGYASNEACAKLKKDLPVITMASVRNTSGTNGSIMLMWSKPNALDTIQTPGPYTYKIYHSPDMEMGSPSLVKTISSTDFHGLQDTIFIDTLINTVASPYSYKIEFYNTLDGEPKLLGKTLVASSVFLNIRRAHQKLDLKWNFNVPWKNTYYIIYKKNPSSGLFDSIGFSSTRAFTDTGLVNGTVYCYYIRSVGSFFTPGFPEPVYNNSQKVCTSPRDTIPPCPLVLNGRADCDARQNLLSWSRYDSCTKDVTRYKIYYSDRRSNKYKLVDTVMGLSTNTYTDTRATLRYSLAGCYYVTAVDSFDNESVSSNEVCLDNCPRYELPNIFTPDGNGINDVWEAMADYRFVESIDLHLFNRWGQEVYHTTKPEFQWAGKDETSGRRLTDGVYYYICTVNEIYLDGNRPRQLKGVVTILH